MDIGQFAFKGPSDQKVTLQVPLSFEGQDEGETLLAMVEAQVICKVAQKVSAKHAYRTKALLHLPVLPLFFKLKSLPHDQCFLH